MRPLLEDASGEFPKRIQAPVTPLDFGRVALDIDVLPMDNSQTLKEGVSYTYKGYDGYSPLQPNWARRAGTLDVNCALAVSMPKTVFWKPSSVFCPEPAH